MSKYEHRDGYVTPKSVPVLAETSKNASKLKGAELYEARGSFELYIKEGELLVKVIDYHPEILRLKRSDLEELIRLLDK